LDRRREPLPTRVEDTPSLPPGYHVALERGLTGLGLVLPPAALAAIEGHVRLLLAWTGRINLTAIRDPSHVAVRHVVDSLTAVAWLQAHGVGTLLDIGSGAGFPGIPLAAALPTVGVTLLEPVGKKSRFLSTAVAATGLGRRVAVRTARAEDLAGDDRQRGHWPAVAARAVGNTAELVELAFPLLAPAGSLIAWKRGDLAEELAAARRAIDALGGGTLDVLEVGIDALPGHRLVVATRAADSIVPERYPRDPAARRRRPS
jgi:16S rRNA (guanine527-N7)-methyltransferase